MDEQNEHIELAPEPSPRQLARVTEIPLEKKAVPAPLPPAERHSRKCQICHHPEREDIDHLFVNWAKPKLIAQMFEIPWISLYRHARALDLYGLRRNNMRSVLDKILERGVEAEITGDTILRAIRAYSCLNDENKWVETASHVVFSTKTLPETSPPRANLRLPTLPRRAPTIDIAV